MSKYINKQEQRVLILNTPSLLSFNDFYLHFFRVPEVFNRLRQYREILKKNDLSVPVWLYCSTEHVKHLKGTPRISVLNFLVNIGMLERYLERQEWPDYVISQDFLISSLSKESTFEKWALYFTYNNYTISNKLTLYKSHFSFPKMTFSHLELLHKSSSLEDLIATLNPLSSPYLFQLIAPGDEKIIKLLCDFQSGHFLERDEELKWLWPVWKRNEISYHRKKNSFKKLS